jgi:long-chain acyl-CoA synthetase
VVDNVCVLAFPAKTKPIAIVVPDEKALLSAVKKHSIESEVVDYEQLIQRDDVKAIIMKDLLAAGKVSGLQGFEMVSGIIVAQYPWTPENVLSLKLFLILGPCYGRDEIVSTKNSTDL